MGGTHNALYRWTGGKFGGHVGKAPVLLLTVAGRKTGKRRTTPLLYGTSGDGLVVIASMGGAPKSPGWYFNLQNAEADVQIGREHRRVRARDAEGEERERLWAKANEVWPHYAEYAQKTDREIPVVVLERTSG
jgi:deazaflavin-dependent oxidoreductase (nitroreductase family)